MGESCGMHCIVLLLYLLYLDYNTVCVNKLLNHNIPLKYRLNVLASELPRPPPARDKSVHEGHEIFAK